MQIEMTPYGRYLYSIGKFKPHSYEFVDDDIVYKISGSTEAQEAAHTRIVSETPKLKVNRAFQDEAPQVLAPSSISKKRIMIRKNNQRQPDLFALGKSSYSSEKAPSFQVSMLKGDIYSSSMTNEDVSSVFIPQINIDFDIVAALKNNLETPRDIRGYVSRLFDDGSYIDISFEDKIIHLKEFGSFYEKENFEIEVFLSQSTGELKPLRFEKERSLIVNDMLVEDSRRILSDGEDSFVNNIYADENNLAYYFDIEVDEMIPTEELCKAVDKLEINNQFLDEEIICPDQRTDRFDIYATRVSPEDLEDCD